MKSLSCEEGSPHLIRRDNIYLDVLKMYTDFGKLSKEFPFRIAFDDEGAVDSGGVSRDMFSGFWKVAFEKLFDGAGSVVPATHPSVDLGAFPILGKILSHGYISCGFLPVHISFPILAAVLLGPDVSIEDKILLKSFIEHLNYHDASIVKRAFEPTKEFSQELLSSLTELLSLHGCRQIPCPSDISSIITAIAKHEFLVKPLGALLAMNRGIPDEHRAFWTETSVGHLFDVFVASNATVSSVLKAIKEPSFRTSAEKCAYGFLVQYIGNLRGSGIRDFLRFVTGSSALVVDSIYVTFNGLEGLGRRPLAHTCSSTLELPTTYATSIEFSNEFTAILQSELSWIMDSI